MNIFTKRILYLAVALTIGLLLAWSAWRGFARPSFADLGDGLFFEAHLSGPDTNCILVQLPPQKDYKRPTLWSRVSPFQTRWGESAGPVVFTRVMKDVLFFGGYRHVLVTEILLREYGHDPAEFLPVNFKESRDYFGAKWIYFRKRSGTPRERYECARQSLNRVGIALVNFGPEIVLLVPQADADRFARIEAEDLRRREGTVEESSHSDGTAQESEMFRNFTNQVRSESLNPAWHEMALRTQVVMQACLKSSLARGQPAKVGQP